MYNIYLHEDRVARWHERNLLGLWITRSIYAATISENRSFSSAPESSSRRGGHSLLDDSKTRKCSGLLPGQMQSPHHAALSSPEPSKPSGKNVPHKLTYWNVVHPSGKRCQKSQRIDERSTLPRRSHYSSSVPCLWYTRMVEYDNRSSLPARA